MVDSKKLIEAAICIDKGMTWSKTTEGFEYWERVRDRLVEIAQEEDTMRKEMVGGILAIALFLLVVITLIVTWGILVLGGRT